MLAGKFTSKQLQFAKVEPGPTFIQTLAEVRSAQPAAPAAVPQAAANPAAETVATTATPDTQATPNSLPPTNETTAAAAATGESVIAAPVVPSVASQAAVASEGVQRRYSFKLIAGVLGKALNVLTGSVFQGFKFVFIPFYVLGHFELFRRKPEWFSIGFIVLLGAAHVAALLGVFILSGYIAHRHVIPLVALGMPVTGLGIVFATEHLAPLKRLSPDLAQWGTAALCAAMVLPYTLRPFCREFIPVIDATHWVEQHAQPGSGIICNSPYVAFYGHLPVTTLDHHAGSIADALRLAPTPARYDYIVLHVGAHGYRDEWLTELEPNYRQVQMFPDPGTGGRPKKVLVFESKDEQLRQAHRDAR